MAREEIVLGTDSGTFWTGRTPEPWRDDPREAKVFTSPREVWRAAMDLQETQAEYLEGSQIELHVRNSDEPRLTRRVTPVERRVPFVTVSSCTGTDGIARELERRTAGAVESMEGAAIAHVAHLHGVPVGEVRGISNLVTNRDTTTWRLKQAAAAAQEAVLSWIAQR